MKHKITSSILVYLMTITLSFSGTYVVTLATDYNSSLIPGSLRWAADQANNDPNSDIVFDKTLDFIPIMVEFGSISISESTRILGNGIDRTILDGDQLNHGFGITGTSSQEVQISNLTMQHFKEEAGLAGGAIMNLHATIQIDHCDFLKNTAHYGGGAIYNQYGYIDLYNVHFSDNSTVHNSGALMSYGGTVKLEKCYLFKNKSTTTNTVGSGAIKVAGGIMNISNTEFKGNSAFQNNFSCISAMNCSLNLSNCTLQGNYASLATIDLSEGVFSIENTLISGNESAVFYMIDNTSSIYPNTELAIKNSTFTGNNSIYTNSSIVSSVTSNASVIIANTIISGNQALTNSYFERQIYTSAGGNLFGTTPNNLSLHSSDISGTTTYPLSPSFIFEPTVPAPTTTGDFRLKPCSRAINLGSNTNLPIDIADIDQDGNTTELLPFDLDYNPRIATGRFITPKVDAGVYEFQGIPRACAITPPRGLSVIGLGH